MESLDDVLILLTASVVCVSLFRRLHLPPILAYLVVGVIVGPYGAGLISDAADVRLLAEFGVVFLLFTIGLEFSLPQLVAMRWTVMGLGGAQVIVTAGVIGGLAWLAGTSWQGAVVVGGALAMSSTAIVTKQLTEQLEIHSRHGRKAMGILLFQDLAVIPLLIAIPTLAGAEHNGLASTMAVALAKGLAVFVIMLLIGRWALRPLFHEVAAARSNEVFTLAVLLVTLLAAWITHEAGLSLQLGAFLAGIMLGETEFRHQIESDIRPFRDILLGLFFITVGMLLDVTELRANWYWILAAVPLLMLFKGALIALFANIGSEDRRVGLRTGVILSQGGEFGFALISLALAAGLIGSTPGQLTLAAIIVSMAAAPFLIRFNELIARRVVDAGYANAGAMAKQQIEQVAQGLESHVIICGYGRTGQNVSRFLEHEGIPFIALDLDPTRVREAQEAGEPVNFGDSARREILEAAGLARAQMVVVSYEDPPSTFKLLRHVQEACPNVPVLVRTRDDVYLRAFSEAGATEVVPEVLEASLMLASHCLALLEVPMSRVIRYIREVRADQYRMLKGYFHGQERMDLEKAGRFREQLHAVTLPEDAYAIGRTLAELDLDSVDVSVTTVRRGGIRGPQPEPETVLLEGDVLVLYGTPEDLERAESLLMRGSA